jgi:hypothetical protein
MMMKTNPITPPPELIGKWHDDWHDSKAFVHNELEDQDIAAQAAQWGADQELEACINYFYEYDRQRWGENSKLITGLRKPPSLKEEALKLARSAGIDGAYVTFDPKELALIRRALEAIDD